MTKDELKAYARSLGFDEVGIARPTPSSWSHYARWIQLGYHGEMGYLARRAEERRFPSLLLLNTKSIIVVAKNYLTVELEKPSSGQPFQPVVSRYAWGSDYHDVMAEPLQKLVEYIETATSKRHQAKWCVDTAPVLEKDFAAQAGIGWIGKHTNNLSRTLGNWYFIGAVLTTLELPPDRPASQHCGTCTRCLDSCPTHAFISPYVLDARKCISYLTIELRGPIPRELRPLIGQRIFGCDDCLEVCPWNRFAIPTLEFPFFPRAELERTSLLDLMALTEEEFRRMFKNSPVKRTKRRGLLRNVAVALGNTRDPKAVPVLTSALNDDEPLIRGHAAWALGRIGGSSAFHSLNNRLAIEQDEWVREEITLALDQIDPHQSKQ